MILYLVDELGRMLQAHADGDALGLDGDTGLSQIAIDIAGRMACGQNHRAAILLLLPQTRSLHAYDPSPCLRLFKNQARHLRLEMHLTTFINNGIAHVLDDLGQTVGTYMGMGIGKDGRRGTVLSEHIENLIRIATLLAARVEFAVAICTSAALAKAVVALIIHLLRT